jgi:hypothetical protein
MLIINDRNHIRTRWWHIIVSVILVFVVADAVANMTVGFCVAGTLCVFKR